MLDVVPERVNLVNKRKSPIQDDYIEAYLAGYKAEADEDIKISYNHTLSQQKTRYDMFENRDKIL